MGDSRAGVRGMLLLGASAVLKLIRCRRMAALLSRVRQGMDENLGTGIRRIRVRGYAIIIVQRVALDFLTQSSGSVRIPWL
jgi:hypothetical protein